MSFPFFFALYLAFRRELMIGEERTTILAYHPRLTRRGGNLDKPRTTLMAFRKFPTSLCEG
jgi:hypothetical protein